MITLNTKITNKSQCKIIKHNDLKIMITQTIYYSRKARIFVIMEKERNKFAFLFHLHKNPVFSTVSRMLVYDHALRITPKEALDHPYFLPVRDQKK